jgi:hypothetical protein
MIVAALFTKADSSADFIAGLAAALPSLAAGGEPVRIDFPAVAMAVLGQVHTAHARSRSRPTARPLAHGHSASRCTLLPARDAPGATCQRSRRVGSAAQVTWRLLTVCQTVTVIVRNAQVVSQGPLLSLPSCHYPRLRVRLWSTETGRYRGCATAFCLASTDALVRTHRGPRMSARRAWRDPARTRGRWRR